MSKVLKNIIFFGAAVLILYACRKDRVDLTNRDLGRDYVNYVPDFFVDYQVDSIHYNSFDNSIDTFNFQIRFLNDTFIQNSIEEDVMRLEQYRRKDTSELWKIEKAFIIKLNNKNAVRVVDNLKKIILSFPISLNALWDGNSKNAAPLRYFFYDKIHENFIINGFDFDSTITVIQEDANNIGEEKYIEETYAKNIGLIEQKITFVEKDIQKLRGFKTHYKIIDHGQK